MSTSKVLPLTEFRGRRERRRDLAFALHRSDRHRDRILRHLWNSLTLTGADRAAAVWVDEYGPGVVHPHVVLDVGADTPRTGFSLDLLRRTWQEGVPGVVDVPNDPRSASAFVSEGARSSLAVSLGSDGLRAWFVVMDSSTPRPPLDKAVVEEILFLAGECAGVLLHRDLDLPVAGESGPRERRFGAWPVLRDAPEGEGESLLHRRISCRFLVARAVRALLEEDLALPVEELEERVSGVRRELVEIPADDPEGRVWDGVLAALEKGDRGDLAGALMQAAGMAEEQGHWHGAAELYRMVRSVATAASAASIWLDATHRLARVCRNLGEWEEAVRWYGVAQDTARSLADPERELRAMDGLANLHIVRGNMPRARAIVDETLAAAGSTEDRDLRATLFHTMMTVAHTEGRIDDAARWGWKAVREYDRDEKGRLRSLTALGGVFLESRSLAAAEDAFGIVAVSVRDRITRLYALAGLALVAAHRRESGEFRRRLGVLDEAGFADGPPELRAEVLLECGDGFLVLGEEEEARRWYGRAAEVARGHGVSEFLIRAEDAIERLDRLRTAESRETLPDEDETFLEGEELEEILGGLDRMRREVGGAVV